MILFCDTSALIKRYIREEHTDRMLSAADVQLAAARTLHEASREPVRFACFDRRLQNAGRGLGLESVQVPDQSG